MKNNLLIILLFSTLHIMGQKNASDLELITTAVENYFYGYIERDGAKLEKAFDLENGTMKVLRKEENGTEWVENMWFKDIIPGWSAREKLSDADLANCDLEILSIDAIDNEIASVKIRMKVVETTYIDMLQLHRLDSEWKITNKCFIVEEKE